MEITRIEKMAEEINSITDLVQGGSKLVSLLLYCYKNKLDLSKWYSLIPIDILEDMAVCFIRTRGIGKGYYILARGYRVKMEMEMCTMMLEEMRKGWNAPHDTDIIAKNFETLRELAENELVNRRARSIKPDITVFDLRLLTRQNPYDVRSYIYGRSLDADNELFQIKSLEDLLYGL